MNFNRYSTFLFFFAFYSPLMAQDNILDVLKSSEERGNKYYKSGNYTRAVEVFDQLINDDRSKVEAKRKLADSYWKLRYPQKARRWYEELLTEDRMDLSEGERVNYIGSLINVKEYDKAALALEEFLSDYPDNQEAERYLQSINSIDDYYSDSWRYKVENLKLNTPEDDFIAGVFKDSLLILVSGRNDAEKITKEEFDIEDLDLFQVPINAANTMNLKGFGAGVLNTKYPEGSITFITNYLVVFARTTPQNKSGDNVYRLKLYQSKLVKGKWTKPEVLSLNVDDASSGHPVFDQSSGYLYFSSDRSGGQGGNDLYRSKYANQSWASPENLGDRLNTNGDEMFPTIKNQSLFFSSDGHGGLGMLDIFETKISDIGADIVNVGSPLNSSYDDFSLTWKKDLKSGFFSSNRLGDEWKDEIYAFEYDATDYFKQIDSDPQPETITTEIPVDLSEKDIMPIKNDSIDENTELPEVMEEPVLSKEVKVIKLGNLIHFAFERYDLFHDPSNKPILRNIVQIMNDNPNSILEIIGHTDFYGGEDYNMGLGERRALAVKGYLTDKGFDEGRVVVKSYGESEPIASNNTFKGRRLNRRVEFKLTLY